MLDGIYFVVPCTCSHTPKKRVSLLCFLQILLFTFTIVICQKNTWTQSGTNRFTFIWRHRGKHQYGGGRKCSRSTPRTLLGEVSQEVYFPVQVLQLIGLKSYLWPINNRCTACLTCHSPGDLRGWWTDHEISLSISFNDTEHAAMYCLTQRKQKAQSHLCTNTSLDKTRGHAFPFGCVNIFVRFIELSVDGGVTQTSQISLQLRFPSRTASETYQQSLAELLKCQTACLGFLLRGDNSLACP